MAPPKLVACLALTISCAVGFVPAAPRASFQWRTRARGSSSSSSSSRTAVHLLPGGGEPRAVLSMSDASSALLRRVATDAANLDVDLSGAHHHPDGGGGGLLSFVSPQLLASAAPGNAFTATGLFGIAALVIALGAGILVASTVTGKNGLGAFLSQEKGSNPFYQDTMAKYTPKTPDILNKIRLPELDFVEVYNQPPSSDAPLDVEEDTTYDPMAGSGVPDANTIAKAEDLRERLLMAVQAKDYDLASSLERELANFLRKNGMGFEGDK